MFDPTISLGNILTACAALGGLLLFFHQFDKRIDIRHVENKAVLYELNENVKELKVEIIEMERDIRGVDKRVAVLEALSRETCPALQAFNIKKPTKG